MNRIICITLSLVLFMSPWSYGQDPDFIGQAEVAIRENHKRAAQFAEYMAQKDLVSAMTALDREIGNASNMMYEASVVPRKMLELMEKLNDLEGMDERDLAASEKLLNEAIAHYTKIVRDRFDLSWLGEEVEHQFRHLGPSLKLVINEYARLCENGRSDANFSSELPPQEALPPIDFFVYVGYSESGGRSTFGVEYESLNYKDKKMEEYQDTINVASSVGGLAASFYLAGPAATASSFAGVSNYAAANTFMPAYAAVAWVAVAVVVVMAIVSSSRAARIKHRLTKKQHEASVKILEESYFSREINTLYKDSCKQDFHALSSVATLIDRIERNSEEDRQEIERILSERESWKLFFSEYQIAQSSGLRYQLYQLWQKEQCVDGGPCTEAGESVRLAGSNVSIPTTYTTQDAEKDEAEYTAFVDRSDFDAKIRGYIEFTVTEVFGVNYPASLAALADVSRLAIHKKQERAFNRIKAALKLRRQLHLERSEDFKSLVEELGIAKEFDGFYSSFIDLVALSIKVTFSSQEFSSLDTSYGTWKSSFDTFASRYRHIDEVSRLENSATELERIMRL